MATGRDPNDLGGTGAAGAFGGPGQLYDIADFSKQLSSILDAAKLSPQADNPAAAEAFTEMMQAYTAHPQALHDAQLDLANRQSDLLQQMAQGLPDKAADADPRFSDPAWREDPFFDFLRRSYRMSSDWTESLAWNAPGMSQLARRRSAFFLKQALAAAAPSNTLSSNPRAIKAFRDSNGATAMRGLDLLRQDIEHGDGRISVQQTDEEAFHIGQDLAVTPGQVVMKNDLIELIRYDAATKTVFETPLLIFPPWINKYYVLDLTAQNSLVGWLRDQGFTVYMASWRSADDVIAGYGWDDYVRLGGDAALDFVSAAHQAPVNVAGYCVGGALASLVSGRLAARGDDRIASLTLLAAQTDFTEPGDLGLFIDDRSIERLKAMISDAGGVMPGEAMRDAFNLLRPEDLIWRYVEQRYLLGEAPRKFDLLFWNSDQTNLPGPLHIESLTRLYLENALATGRFEIDGAAVDLSKIEAPVFIHAARKDHISPAASVYKGVKLFGGDVTFVLADSGHIAGVVNPPAAKKYRHWTRPDLVETFDAWMSGAEERPGSWWPLWAVWLGHRSGEQRKPPAKIKGAAPAPGGYVLETLKSIRTRRGL
jgi:polyhydroxyalkanoate synthase